MNTEQIGISSVLLGAGRAKKEDRIDPGAGILLHAKTGDCLRSGDVIATLYANDPALFHDAAAEFCGALRFSEEAPEPIPLIFKTIHAE